jgi:surfeit locus 1 family protein
MTNMIDDFIENEQFRRFFPPLAATFLILLFVSLGLWQLDRAAEKNSVRAQFEDDAPYTQVTGDMPVTEFQRIEASGHYLGERQVLIDNMFLDGRPGLYAITAFRYSTDRPLLIVNRGFIARPPANAAKPDLGVAADTRTIRGRVGSLPKVGIRSRDAFQDGDDWPKTAIYPTLEDLSGALGEDLLPFVLLLGPEMDDGFVRRWQPHDRGPMMHYGYALQWFAMAAAVAGIFVWRLRKKRV